MSDLQPTTVLQRSSSEPTTPAEPDIVPKRTFTLPTGQPVSVVQVPASAATEAAPIMPEPFSSSPIANSLSSDAEAVEKVIVVEEEKHDLISLPPAEIPVTAAPTVITEVVAVPQEEAATMMVRAATMPTMMSDAAPVPVDVVPTTAVTEARRMEIVEKPAMLIEKRSSLPIMPSMQVVEERIVQPTPTPVLIPVVMPEALDKSDIPAAAPVLIPVEAVQKLQTPVPPPTATLIAQPVLLPPTQVVNAVGTLEPLKRRIAIFNSYVALSSTTLRFSDKFHHELLDESGSAIFHLHNKHQLSDEHNNVLACLHKSLFLGRWHVESMKHQTRLLTARRKQHGMSMRITIHNCFTDRAEELLYLRGRLYDGTDPTINRIAVMFDRDGVVQVAKGFDAGIAAVLAFVINAWDWRGPQICCA